MGLMILSDLTSVKFNDMVNRVEFDMCVHVVVAG